MRDKVYPSDITRADFEAIKPILEQSIKKRRPREVDLYEIYCALLYVLKSGCQWRMLASDFPKWQNVYRYFRVWCDRVLDKEGKLLELSIFENALKEKVGKCRLKMGKNANATLGISDSQSIKNTDTAEQKGYDGGKKNIWRQKTCHG